MDNDLRIFALTLYYEGGSTLGKLTSIEDIVAIAWVIKNRVESKRNRGRTFKEICLQKKQFSCWNNLKPERVHPSGWRWDLCIEIANCVTLVKNELSPIGKSTMYYNPDIVPEKRIKRIWNFRKLVERYYKPKLNHKFYEVK